MTSVVRTTRRPADGWLDRFPDDSAPARLFCLPYSGCGTSMFRQWPRRRTGVEFLFVQPPGREDRFHEPHYETVEALVEMMLPSLEPFLDRPFAFFGHCGSSLPAYEASVRLACAGRPAAALFVSSQVSPQDGPFGRFLEMDDAELLGELQTMAGRLGGTLHDDLAEVYLEILRNDIEANKRYHRPSVRLPHRVTAIGWDQDTEVPSDRMSGWAACGNTRFVVMPGPHYTFLDAPASLMALFDEELGTSAHRSEGTTP